MPDISVEAVCDQIVTLARFRSGQLRPSCLCVIGTIPAPRSCSSPSTPARMEGIVAEDRIAGPEAHRDIRERDQELAPERQPEQDPVEPLA